MPTIKVLLVGRQPVSLAGLKALIDGEPTLEVIGRWLQPTDVAASLAPRTLDVALIDHGDGEGLAPLTATVNAIDDELRIVLLTGATDPAMLSAGFRSGVRGFVSKRQRPETLVRAIDAVHRGEVWLDRGLTSTLITSLLRPDEDPPVYSGCPLSQRDHQIIGLVGEGLTNRQIAETLHVSAATVSNRLTVIFQRLGLSGRFELVVYACQHGFVRMPEADRPPERNLRLV